LKVFLNCKILVQRIEYEIPDNEEPLICIASDKEYSSSTLAVLIKHPVEDPTIVGSYRNSLLSQLYSGMINTRFSEISQKPESPFIYGVSEYGSFIGRSRSAYNMFAMPKENKIKESLEVLMAENEKVKRFGFTKI
jgi:zinc protease